MTEDLFQEPDGATPLIGEDATGLIPTWVATRAELNLAEQENIAKALAWASASRSMGSLGKLLTVSSMSTLHKRMFGDVWRWVGSYRQHDTNMGASWPYIPTQVSDLLADVLTQISGTQDLAWSADELAVRFHHRLVAIHPFPNGNGRHARLAADLLIHVLGGPAFSWGSEDLSSPGQARDAYLNALRLADRAYEYGPLVAFARS